MQITAWYGWQSRGSLPGYEYVKLFTWTDKMAACYTVPNNGDISEKSRLRIDRYKSPSHIPIYIDLPRQFISVRQLRLSHCFAITRCLLTCHPPSFRMQPLLINIRWCICIISGDMKEKQALNSIGPCLLGRVAWRRALIMNIAASLSSFSRLAQRFSTVTESWAVGLCPLSWWDQFNQFNPAHFRTACVLRLSQSRYFTVTCMTTMRISVHVLNVPLSWHHRHPIQLYLNSQLPNDDAWIIASAWLQTYKHSPYNVVLRTLVHYWKTNHTDLPFWAIISYARFLRGVECRPSLL